MSIIVTDRSILKSGKHYYRPSDLLGNVNLCDVNGETLHCIIEESYGVTSDLFLTNGVSIRVGVDSKLEGVDGEPIAIKDMTRSTRLKKYPWKRISKNNKSGVYDLSDFSVLGSGEVDIYSRRFLRLAGWYLAGCTQNANGVWRLVRGAKSYRHFLAQLEIWFNRYNITVLECTKTSVKLAPNPYFDMLKEVFGYGDEKCIADEILLRAPTNGLRDMIWFLELGKNKDNNGLFTTRTKSLEFCADLGILYDRADVLMNAMYGENVYRDTKGQLLTTRFRWSSERDTRVDRESEISNNRIASGKLSTPPRRVYKITPREPWIIPRKLWMTGLSIYLK